MLECCKPDVIVIPIYIILFVGGGNEEALWRDYISQNSFPYIILG